MRLSTALKDKRMDVRLREKLLGEKKLTSKEVDSYLSSLDDSAGQMEYAEEETAKAEEEAPTE